MEITLYPMCTWVCIAKQDFFIYPDNLRLRTSLLRQSSGTILTFRERFWLIEKFEFVKYPPDGSDRILKILQAKTTRL